MTKIDLHTQVSAPVEPVWDVMTLLDEKGLGSLGIQTLETSTGRLQVEEGMQARLRLAMRVSRFTVGGLVTVRFEQVDSESHQFGLNILNAPDGIRGKVAVALSQSENNSATNLRFHGDLRLPFKAALAFPFIQPIIESQVMPHVGETLSKRAQPQGS